MNLSHISIIARKEFVDVLRDRRTLFFMMLLPMVAMPLLMLAGTKFMKKQLTVKEARILTVAIDAQQEQALRALAVRWKDRHLSELAIIGLKLGLDFRQEGEALNDVLDRVAKIQATGGMGGDTLAQAYSSFAALSDIEKQLLADLKATNRFLDQNTFVRFDSLSGEGVLAVGIEIPENLPVQLANLSSALAIQNKEIQAAVYLPDDMLQRLDMQAGSVPIHVLYDRSINLSKECHERLTDFVAAMSRDELDVRLDANGLRRGFAQPLVVENAGLATTSRQVQALIGGFLPYLLFIFAFMGAFYPALDLTAGEKERFTLETLLLSPVSRMDIAAGKFVVTFVASIVAAVLFTASLYFTITKGILPSDLAQGLNIQFEPLALLLTTSLLIPIAALIAAVVLGVALCGRSFKEAQNYVTPLQFLLFIPSLAALLPDLETETYMAWIPLVNVSMLMKELLKGNYLWDFYWITLGSMLVLTMLVLWGASWLFRRENVLMRT